MRRHGEVAVLLADRVARPSRCRSSSGPRSSRPRTSARFGVRSYETSSKTKNSASGPKYAVSAIPVSTRYASARLATSRGSRSYGSRVSGSSTPQMQRQRRHARERVERRRRRVREQQHVRLGDALPAADRRAVEAEALVEGLLAERRQGQRDVLPGAEQVGELQVDHLRPGLARELDRVARGLPARRPSRSTGSASRPTCRSSHGHVVHEKRPHDRRSDAPSRSRGLIASAAAHRRPRGANGSECGTSAQTGR